MNELWRRLDGFRFDVPQAGLTFTQRLARENEWTVGYSHRVVQEYRCFLYLAMTSGIEVTPSDQVDQAWHLHLTYTRSYWHDLCGEVLGEPLHHGPTRGTSSYGERYREQYAQTLLLYRELLGHEPPADI